MIVDDLLRQLEADLLFVEGLQFWIGQRSPREVAVEQLAGNAVPVAFAEMYGLAVYLLCLTDLSQMTLVILVERFLPLRKVPPVAVVESPEEQI